MAKSEEADVADLYSRSGGLAPELAYRFWKEQSDKFPISDVPKHCSLSKKKSARKMQLMGMNIYPASAMCRTLCYIFCLVGIVILQL